MQNGAGDKHEEEWDDRLKAHVERIVEEMGCTWWDIVMENRDLFSMEWRTYRSRFSRSFGGWCP